jgi:CheY-like chemotaxis protein
MAARLISRLSKDGNGFCLLHVCYDAMLTSTRELLFQGAGYGVVSSCGLSEAVKRCAQGDNFDLLILCHSVPHADKQHIIGAFRRERRAPILALTNEYEWISGAHATNASDPAELLHTVAGMLEPKAQRSYECGVEIPQKKPQPASQPDVRALQRRT